MTHRASGVFHCGGNLKGKGMKQKRFVPGTPTHNYQKGFCGNLLFYSLLDRLIYFSLFCTEAKRHHVTVLSLNLMMTHIHALISTDSKKSQTEFNRAVERLYARAFNQVSGLNGPVFMKTYGWAQKRNSAKVRSCLAYIGNNHVEKKICRRGIEERWSLLAYAFGTHPFSEPLVIRRASARMKKAVKLIRDAHQREQYLNHTLLKNIFKGLDQKECEQLIDFIIVSYSVIDYDKAARYFGSMEKMIAAFDTTTGSEYELTEEDEPETDTAYIEMLKYLKKQGYDLVTKDFLGLSGSEKSKLMKELTRKTSASIRQASRLLRLPYSKTVAPRAKEAGPFLGGPNYPFFTIPYEPEDYAFQCHQKCDNKISK